MRIDEVDISRAIIKSYQEKLLKALDVDVAIVGAGPSGMCCAYYLAKANKRVVIFERNLSVGGGMWGGGIMFNEIVFQEKAKEILDEFGVRAKRYSSGYYLADSIETVATICSKTIKAGANILNLISAEDVMVRHKKISGLVLNWTAVEMAKLHVDPIAMKSRFVVDATGHAAEVVHIVERKSGVRLKTKTAKFMGESSMRAEAAEKVIIKNSREVAAGLYVCGMAANATFGGPRMGPIFGGMLLSGKRVAEQLESRL
jgi:thiamine thiazole synthase